MTEIGKVIEGKYEIVKEIGRGGMSIVYLAKDIRLNKQWAIKEIWKKGSNKNDVIVINSLLAEVNVMKNLDHPALPRIVDIIDQGITIYIVMDYIEGISLDKYLKEHGPQSEACVIEWSIQICEVLSYLHSQKPPIIYRDMKPANIMLKPEGLIKLIDFGIAREYKEQNILDTTSLGTKGYAPPEQYSGKTDPRSDIFALGMTMHHLLTGIDPINGEAYIPIRQWNPQLSEAMERIVNRCVEPVMENRYQSCNDLLYDLQHPTFITKSFKRKQISKVIVFVFMLTISIIFAIVSVCLKLSAIRINNNNYDLKLTTSNPINYYKAIEIYPARVEAYEQLIHYYKNQDVSNEEIIKLGNTIEIHGDVLDLKKVEVAELFYNMGKLYFSDYKGSFKSRIINAKNFFEKAAAQTSASFDKKIIANCYDSICKFMLNQSSTSEHSLEEYQKLFQEINTSIKTIAKVSGNEANYDQISLYYVVILFINDQGGCMAGVGFEKVEVLNVLANLQQKVQAITSTLTYVNELKAEIVSSYELFVENINTKYNEVEKRK